MASLTALQLLSGSIKVQPDVVEKSKDVNIRIDDLKITNMIGMKTKLFSATIRSAEDNKAYNTVIAFYDVNQPDINAPSLSLNKCRIRCSCHSFYFYFSWYDMVNDALYGRDPKPYIRKTHPGEPNYKPPVNPDEIPGMCKHLVFLVRSLREAGYVTE